MLHKTALSLIALLAATSIANAADLGGKSGQKVVKVEAPQEEGMGPDDSYGFIDSSNAGKAGDKGVSLENTFRIGKANGRYFVLNSKLEATYNPIDRLQFALGFWGAHHNVANVALFNGTDRNKTAFDGISFATKYQFIERDQGPLGFGLGMQVSYRWQRVSDGLLLEGNRHNFGFALQADRTLIQDKLFMALNASFANGTETIAGNGTSVDSGYELGAALSYKLLDNAYIGLNARYATAYSGAWLNGKSGQAVYVGPTLNVSLPNNWSIIAAWTPQVWGKDMSGASPSGKDFSSFERHQVRLKIAKSF